MSPAMCAFAVYIALTFSLVVYLALRQPIDDKKD